MEARGANAPRSGVPTGHGGGPFAGSYGGGGASLSMQRGGRSGRGRDAELSEENLTLAKTLDEQQVSA